MKKLYLIFLMLFLMPVILTGCHAQLVFPNTVFDFFAGYQWQDLIGMIFFVLFGLLPGFNIFQWIKTKIGWENGKAHALVMALSVGVTALCMFLAGVFQFDQFEFTLEKLIEWGAFVYTGSQIAYQRFKNSQ